jgi:hypothetical protein
MPTLFSLQWQTFPSSAKLASMLLKRESEVDGGSPGSF